MNRLEHMALVANELHQAVLDMLAAVDFTQLKPDDPLYAPSFHLQETTLRLYGAMLALVIHQDIKGANHEPLQHL